MIKSIVSGGRYMIVSNGSTSTYINNNGSSHGVGNMRFNSNTQNTEVYDGNNWIIMNTTIPTVQLSNEAESLLDWARNKRNEELQLEQLADTNPTIKDLVEQIKQKQDQIKMVQNLIKKDNEWDDATVQAGLNGTR